MERLHYMNEMAKREKRFTVFASVHFHPIPLCRVIHSDTDNVVAHFARLDHYVVAVHRV